MKNLLSLVAVAVLASCATSSTVGQVQEVGPGTYKIGFSLIQEPTTTNAAPVQLKAQKQQDQTNGAAQN